MYHNKIYIRESISTKQKILRLSAEVLFTSLFNAGKIATATWRVGGAGWNLASTAGIKNMYSKEMTSNVSTTYSAKIGLMYASNYGFTASLKYWALPGFENAVRPTFNLLASVTYASGTSTKKSPNSHNHLKAKNWLFKFLFEVHNNYRKVIKL